jgi:hypothetical protein
MLLVSNNLETNILLKIRKIYVMYFLERKISLKEKMLNFTEKPVSEYFKEKHSFSSLRILYFGSYFILFIERNIPS